MSNYLSDEQINAQYKGFKIVGFTYNHNPQFHYYSGVIEIKFPNAEHEDFDDYKCDNFIVYDDDCTRIAFDYWYPDEVRESLANYVREQILKEKA